jgi:hypothetical protein
VPGFDPVLLFMDFSLQDPPIQTQKGPFYLPWKPMTKWYVGMIPANGILDITRTVPASWSPGFTAYFQALPGPWHSKYTVLTNLMEVTVE